MYVCSVNINKTLGEPLSVILAQEVRKVGVVPGAWCGQQSDPDSRLVIGTSQYTGNIISDILSPNVSGYFSLTKIHNPYYLFRLYKAGGLLVSGNGSCFDF